ncbi:hypothetical protein DFJ73DRAFT_206763 [Zopfochytrium polystomum]|nr:hypothetical protein DFJ73DRAFT_206763 [Zopfochytrium polystomum]
MAPPTVVGDSGGSSASPCSSSSSSDRGWREEQLDEPLFLLDLLAANGLRFGRSDDGSHRTLVAARPFSRGELIFTNEAIATVVSASASSSRCHYCLFMPKHPLRRCGTCKQAKYCDAACQRRDFDAGHRWLCRFWRDGAAAATALLPPGFDTSGIEFMVKLETAVSRGVPEAVATVGALVKDARAEDADPFCVASSHVALRVLQGAGGAAGAPRSTTAQLQHHLKRVRANAFELVSWGALDPYAEGLFLLGSLPNHSCAPSAVVVYDGRRQTVRAARPLAVGDPVTVTYVDAMTPRDKRRKELAAAYGFWCTCTVCAAPDVLAPAGSALGRVRLRGDDDALTYVREQMLLQMAGPLFSFLKDALGALDRDALVLAPGLSGILARHKALLDMGTYRAIGELQYLVTDQSSPLRSDGMVWRASSCAALFVVCVRMAVYGALHPLVGDGFRELGELVEQGLQEDSRDRRGLFRILMDQLHISQSTCSSLSERIYLICNGEKKNT